MLAQNLQFLRRKSGMSQQELADALEIPRTTWSGYELGKVEPNIAMLQKLASFFKEPVDRLVGQRIDYDDLEVARSNDLRVLAVTMDSHGRQNIELVSLKAHAGYLNSYQDPEYISDLPKMFIPNLPTGSYRAFEIKGDSMLPMPSGSLVITQYVESLKDLKDDKTYVIVTENEGIVYKRIKNHPEHQSLTAISDNEIYPPYIIQYDEIREIWKYHAHIVFSDARQQQQDWLQESVLSLQQKILEMDKKLV